MQVILSAIREKYKVDESAALGVLRKLSFGQYISLLEAPVVPPSGATISPGTPMPSKNPTTTTGKNTNTWAGGSAPLTVGMTVNKPDQSGKLVPADVVTVDKMANGVKIKDPVTGKQEWMNIEDLQDNSQATTESQLGRIKQLAGISEEASAGAVSSAAIASAVPYGKKKTEESILKREYTRKTPTRSIVGDTKPNQASAELSANLAASRKPTAKRVNNGFD